MRISLAQCDRCKVQEDTTKSWSIKPLYLTQSQYGGNSGNKHLGDFCPKCTKIIKDDMEKIISI